MLLAVAAAIAVVIAIKGLETWSQPKELRAVSFSLQDDVGGLQIGDDVRVGGYKVGTVKEISVLGAEEASPEPKRVRVIFSFPRSYVLHRDAMLRIQTGITGASYLNFESLGATGPRLAQNEELTGHPGGLSEALAAVSRLSTPLENILGTVDKKTLPAVNETVGKFAKTAESFTATGDHATKLVDDVHAQIDPIMKKYHVVTDRTAEMMVKIRDLFGDTTPDFGATMASIKSLTGSIDKKVPSMLDRVDALLTRIDTTMESANAALEELKSTAANAPVR